MTKAGVAGHDSGQEKLVCPWHADTKASLHVDWDAAVFNCFGCDVKGGWKRLRELVGEGREDRHNRAARGGIGSRTQVFAKLETKFETGTILPVITEREHERLVAALEEADVQHYGAHLVTVAECRRTFSKWECNKDGSRKTLASSCDFPICPKCLPSRLRKDFQRHRANLPDRVSLHRWKPEGCGDRKQVSDAFKRWRRDQGLTAGLYGVRVKLANGVNHFDVLLVLPADEKFATPLQTSAVAENVDIETAIEWYVQMFLEEAMSWRTPHELLDLLAGIKGRRRFQGFGAYYERSEKVETETVIPDTPKKLGRVSGGSGKGGKREPPACDHCGATMRYMGKALTADEANAWLQGAPLSNGNKCAGEGL
jgi:CHC2 zinc finger